MNTYSILLGKFSLIFFGVLYFTGNVNARYDTSGYTGQQTSYTTDYSFSPEYKTNNYKYEIEQINKLAQSTSNNQSPVQGKFVGQASSSIDDTAYPSYNTASTNKPKTEDPNWQREREKVKVQFQQLEKERHHVENDMATNDKQKDDANITHDDLERLRVHLALIDKSKHAADLLDSVYHNIENWNSHYNYEWDVNHARNKRDEYRNYQKAREQDIQAIKKDIYKQLKRFDKKKDSYDLTIANADASNDLHQRLEIRRKIIPKLRKAADYAHRFTTIANEDHDRMRRLRDEQHKRERELPAIEYDILNKELDLVDRDMAPNEAQIKVADETQDDFERLRVYLNVIQKSKYAADQAEAFTNDVENWNKAYDSKLDANKVRNKRDEYRNYLLAKERDILAIKDNIYAQLKQFDKDKEFYDLAIAEADASNDFNKRLKIRR